MRIVYDKFNNGEPLTDQDLDEGIEFFRQLAHNLSSLGPVFRLSANEARRVHCSLLAFRAARQEKG